SNSSASEDMHTPTPRVYRDKVTPHWIEVGATPTDCFWYSVSIPDGKEFVLVDASKGLRSAAFDHARVAENLAHLLGKSIGPHALPFDSIDFSTDMSKVVLHGRNSNWQRDLKDYNLTALPKARDETNYLQMRNHPHPSRSSATETDVTFINHLTKEVDIFWLDDDGARQPYGSLAPNTEREQHTYSGHAWLVANKDKNVIGVFDAEDKPGIALISESQKERNNKNDNHVKEPASYDNQLYSPDHMWKASVHGDNLFLSNVKSGTEYQLSFDAAPARSYARNAERMHGVEMDYESKAAEQSIPAVYWSPDSQHLVAMLHKSGSQHRITLIQSSPDDQVQPKLISIPYLKPGDDVPYTKPHLFDIKKKEEIPVDDKLFANPWSIDDVRWNPDCSEFTFLFNQRGHQALKIIGVNANTGAARTIIDETSATFICYSSKLFSEYLDATSEIIWMSERDGWNHLYLYDAKAGRVKNQITKGEWVVRGVDFIDREKRQVWFHASGINPEEDPYYLQYYRVNFDG